MGKKTSSAAKLLKTKQHSLSPKEMKGHCHRPAFLHPAKQTFLAAFLIPTLPVSFNLWETATSYSSQLSPGQATHGLFFNIICPFFMLISSKRTSFCLVSQTASANHLEQTQLSVMNKSILPLWSGDSLFLSELLQKQDFWSHFMDGLRFFSGSGIHTELLLHHNKLCSQSNSLSSSYPEQNRIFWLLLPPLNTFNSKMFEKAQV